jgi:hypothetical protein
MVSGGAMIKLNHIWIGHINLLFKHSEVLQAIVTKPL